MKISRGGVFDEAPTFAVCVDPLAEPVRVRGRARRRRRPRSAPSALVVSLWLDPFRLDVHRPDGSAVVETARDDDGRYWAYATLNDAFTRPPPLPPRGRDLRAGGEDRAATTASGRDFTLWNTDVLDPHATRRVHRRPRRRTTRGPTARAPSSTPTTSRSRSSTTRRYPAGAMAGSFVDNGYRGDVRVLAPARSTAIHFAGGQYTEYIFAGPGDAGRSSTAYTWLTGRTAPPPLWALGYHQCRWFDYTQDAVEALGAAPPRRRASRATRCGSTSSTWTATASSPGTPSAFPDAAGHARSAWPRRASGSSRSSTRA